MSANSFLLGGTELNGITLARAGERDAPGTYISLIDEVRSRCGADVAALFAEPVRGSNRTTGLPNIAWYCSREGAAFPLRQLDSAARGPVAELLRERLHRFAGLLAESPNGAVFASWLNVLSPDSVVAVAGQPVLRDWGMLPDAMAGSAETSGEHFRNGLGPFLPPMPPPPFQATDAQGFVAAMGRQAPDAAARAAPPPMPEGSAAGSPDLAASAPPPGAAPPGSVPFGSVPPGSAPLGSAPTWPAPAAPPPASFAAMQPPPGRPSLVVAPSRGWLPPAVAAGAAALVLAVLAFGHVLRYPLRADVGPSAAALDAQRQTNDALRERLARLRATPTDVCRADNGQPATPGAPDRPATPPLLPPPPERTKVQTKDPATSQPETSTLGALLEKATVLVLLKNSLGSGFFVSDRYIVTNHHVVGDASDVKIASRTLGGVVPAKVVAVGSGAERGTQDIAVLEIDPKPGTAALSVGVAPGRLDAVTASGFPGAVLETIEKQSSNNLPEANFTQGIVTSHQVQQPGGIATIIHTAQIGHGNSGGPLVDVGGCAVGINSWLSPDAMDDMIFSTYFQALDASELRSFLVSHNISFTPAETGCRPVAVAEGTPPPVAPPTPTPTSGPATPSKGAKPGKAP